MSSSSEAYSYPSSTFSAAVPSQLDPRFAVNESMEIVQDGETRAYGFSYVDAQSGRQVNEWVFASSYKLPPAGAATAEEPSNPARVFTSLAEWSEALKETGAGAIWQTGSTFSRSWVSTYRGVPSADVSYYAANEEWPVVPVAPSAEDNLEQIDPGRSNAPAGPTATVTGAPASSTDTKADICVTTAAGAGHPERGNTNAYTVEFWTLFSDYVQPTTQPLHVQPGPTPGVTAITLEAYLAYWHAGTDPETPVSLCVETCSRTRVNPYAA
ncbi:hypothetical protein Poly30_23160 [Planctomycetes bacterium Poly30]|uniref:Uncharacterized protein n=1 Tax=Saltatorellus ferox TaxID=2528018 RepID=A0A518ERS3_9BACT|nr:hypothetical protein Poly30_23160 [Planctomycetes bacterium Poly30]